MLLLLCISYGKSQNQTAHYFDNQFVEYQGRNDYYNWKVYLVSDPAFLNSIRAVVYYLDPTFRNSVREITSSPNNPNFTLCCNGWGQFTLKIRIIFKSGQPDQFENYTLDLSPRKRNPQYVCNF
jgi:transcription initiation factor IIF auxiliary subunit